MLRIHYWGDFTQEVDSALSLKRKPFPWVKRTDILVYELTLALDGCKLVIKHGILATATPEIEMFFHLAKALRRKDDRDNVTTGDICFHMSIGAGEVNDWIHNYKLRFLTAV